ncbi:3-deoxy-D-manno-octulosonic-acid transferase [Prosthecobacter debontii]|uniref:3-deoxy-D-manno-octulosonic acid transferase n=2 Tax=Prosthecobacter debontii TaxID=48467 RepID=A0A1T4XK97_9BACT|nr:3-deoxy-D-manno-octulosonic-acid transferase [Prosthecobacter debontii]
METRSRMSLTLSLLIYNLLLPVGLLFMLPGAIRKMRQRGGRWSDLWQRFGFLSAEHQRLIAILPPGTSRLWMHAVSVGEVGIATKLITAMLRQQPGLGIVLTTTTPTGYALATEFAQRQSGRLVVLYSPLDLPGVGRRFIQALAPSQIVLVEAEVWPNLVATARRQSIPVSLVNARLSARSERRFQQLGFLIKPVFSMLHQVLVQEPEDVARWTALAVPAERIHHTGSIKFDPQGAAADPAQVQTLQGILQTAGIRADQPVLLLASTHPGEEALLAQMTQRLRQSHPCLALLIVPRHVERAAALVEELASLGIPVQRRSQITGPCSTLLIDTTGELRAWQELATLVVVGKSFLATGGQNPAEAVMARKPVLFGPHMENFQALIELLLAQEGAVQVPDISMLEQSLDHLLLTPAECARLGVNGHAALARHEGATLKTVQHLL